MYKKILMAIVAIAMISMMFAPAFAWEYPATGASDTKYEAFGPRADEILINLYASETPGEWEGGLEPGLLDITDWPLDHTHLVRYNATLPWTEKLSVYGYGAEFGAYLFDLNNNNNTYLGNPPDPDYDNPMFPNPMGYSVAESGIAHDPGYALRAAIAHLVSRAAVISLVGSDAASAIYTPIPPCYGSYAHPEIRPGGAREDLTYPYDPEEASQILNDSGMFPFDTDGWRYWDRNHNGVNNGGFENLALKLIARNDHPPRLQMAQNLRTELEGAGVKIHVNWQAMAISAARIQWMQGKNGHIYTAGWSLGSTPDSIILWHWDYYWHPGSSYNTGGCNKDAFNDAADGVQYANSQDNAKTACWAAQVSFTDSVLGIAVYANSGFKPMSKTYVGNEAGTGEDLTLNGEYWYGVVNWLGYGIDNGYTFMNMHTSCHEYGGRIRYGMKTPDIRGLNPIYTEWLWDNTVIDLIGYDSLVARDPYTLAYKPWVAKNFTIGTYLHPNYGTCTKVVFTLRNDVYFQDGVQLTLADVYFSFVEIKQILEGRGLPKPWWWSNVQDILSFSILDPLNFEVLLDVKSMWAIGWVGGNRILAKHVWKPICEGVPRPKDGAEFDPTTFAPDINMIGHGAWRIAEYVEGSHILLKKNIAGQTITNNLQDDNYLHSNPITALYGFYRLGPKYVDIHADSPVLYKDKIDPGFPNTIVEVNFTVTDINMRQESIVMTAAPAFPKYPPIVSHNLLLEYTNYDDSVTTCTWHIDDWVDQNPDGVLGYSDRVLLTRTASNVYGPAPGPLWFHVQEVGLSGDNVIWIKLGQIIEADKYIYVDGVKVVGPVHEYEKPGEPIVEKLSVNLTKCYHVVKVVKVVTTRYWLCPDNAYQPIDPIKTFSSGTFNVTYTLPIYITIPEDIVGTYYVNTQLLAPDCKVDLKDVFAAGKAFGSVPGDFKWNTVADMNHDYKIDLKDYFAIAKKFGKW